MDLRFMEENHQNTRARDDGVPSYTYSEQKAVEDSVNNCYNYYKNLLGLEEECLFLHRRKHKDFLLRGLHHLSAGYECLDASRPWLCYWIVHSLRLLDVPIPNTLADQVAGFLEACQSPDGGFAGGPMQLPHLAPTYAAVNALCELGTRRAYSVIDRPALQRFLLSRRSPSGAFTMHEGGEVDIRGAYCALSAARLSHVLTPGMFAGTAAWVASCQTYEGGFAGCPGAEAHGGYSFCGLAALLLLGSERLADLRALLRWTAGRQVGFEGGFQGRTNKLVDGCYSFWQGGAFPLLAAALQQADKDEKGEGDGSDEDGPAKNGPTGAGPAGDSPTRDSPTADSRGDSALSKARWLFDQRALQEYILMCCQHAAGGLIDKPGKPRDYYHTCYCISGLSTAQHGPSSSLVVGDPNNLLRPTHPLYNIVMDAVAPAGHYFNRLPVPGDGHDGLLIEELSSPTEERK